MAKKPATGTIHFVALEDFTSPEPRSTYLKGLSYRIRPGNENLHELVFTKGGWLDKGQVQVVAEKPAATIVSTGKVKEK
jgi:hypothetical protein